MRGSLLLSLVTLALAHGATGCAGSPSLFSSPSAPAGLARERRVLGAAELGALGASNAYEAVRLARTHLGLGSELLEPRQGVRVYVDGLPVFSASELRRMPASWIADVEFLDAAEATRWLGAGHPSGAILISTWGIRR